MKRAAWRTVLTLATAALCAMGPGRALASGGDGFSESVFAPEFSVTERDLPAYGQGQLGVVPSTYWRVYLFLAYRAASGQALTKAELDALQIQGWKIASLLNREDEDPSSARSAWLNARVAVKGTALLTFELEKYDETTYSGYLNCPADGLQRAAATLADRLKTGGPQWAAVWLANQDAVFANCSLTTSPRQGVPKPVSPMPAPLPANAPAWLKHDHDYQTAAALFYAGQFDAARTRFQAIGKNSASPWQKWGGYLAARCLIRKATLERGPSNDSNVEYTKAQDKQWRSQLELARSELTQIGKTFAPARTLIGWVDARLRPAQRLDELAHVLGSVRFTPDSARLLSDYLLVYDRLEDTAMLNASEPLTLWINAMQQTSAKLHQPVLAKVREQLKANPGPLWLVPLLTHARAGELSADELKAAASVLPSSSAYVHLQYHLARLALAQGKTGDADARVTALLQGASAQSVPTRNRLLGVKMLTDPSREGFFKAAARALAAGEAAVTPIPDEAAKPAMDDPLSTDNDYQRHLFRQFSLAELRAARPLTKQVMTPSFASAVWTRAIILGDFTAADDYTDELMIGRETTHHLFRRYKDAKTTDAKRDAAMLILVNMPEFNPHLIRAAGTGTGGEWDCGAGRQVVDGPEDADMLPPPDELDAASPAFLSKASRTQNALEMKTLLALPKRSDYLAPWLLDWAQRNTNDPEVPKALHFFVASTRMECPVYGAKPSRVKSYSQQAFELLHKRYPKSEWAAKTKYFF